MKNIYVIPFYNTDTCKEVVLKIFSCPYKGPLEYKFKFYINDRCEWKCYFFPMMYIPEEADFTSWIQEAAGHLSLTGNFSDINASALFKRICDELKSKKPYFPEEKDSPKENQGTVSRGLPSLDETLVQHRNPPYIDYLQEIYDKMQLSEFGAS